jgi:hypothetical protein
MADLAQNIGKPARQKIAIHRTVQMEMKLKEARLRFPTFRNPLSST